MATVSWHNLDSQEVVKILKTDTERGLTEKEYSDSVGLIRSYTQKKIKFVYYL